MQFGQALGKTLFGDVGPAGVATVRLALAATVLLAVVRPALPSGRRERLVVLGFGIAIAGMNLVYPAMTFLPVGLATSLQLLGPITLALVMSRRLRDVAFVLVAGCGVWLFYAQGTAEYALLGVLLALASGVSMAMYVLMSKLAGKDASSLGPLAWALVVALVTVAPMGIAESGASLLEPHVLLVGLAVAIVGTVAPYTLEFAALRRLPPRVVGVLQSLEPAAAGLAGTIVLGEDLHPAQWLALGLVGAASAGMVAFNRKSGSGASPTDECRRPDGGTTRNLDS